MSGMPYIICEYCGKPGGHTSKCPLQTARGDDPGLAEMNRMEYLMSKAPCLARLDDLADWSEGID